MRTIKFRAWDKQFSDMWSVTSISWANGQFFEFGLARGEMAHGTRNTDQIVLMQFTNLLDKNGKEIYEGDIIQYQTPSGKTHKAEVLFYEDKLKFSKRIIGRPNKYSGIANPKKPNNRFEVIGNIYENPELLTAHK